SIQARRWPVRVVEVEALQDPLVNDPDFGHDLTRIRWEPAQALPFQLELESLTVRGNLGPCTAGATFVGECGVGMDPDALPVPAPDREGIVRAVEREGPNGSVVHLCSLPGTDERLLAYLGDTPAVAHPEVHLEELRWDGGAWV